MPRNDARPPASKTIEQQLAEAEARIHQARSRLPKALESLRMEQAGYPSGGDGGGSSSSSGLDRFLDDRGTLRDPARDELAALQRDAGQLLRTSTAVYDVATRWSQPSRFRPPSDAGDLGCELAAKIKRGQIRGKDACKQDPRPDDDRPVYEPVRVKATRGPRRKGHPDGECDPASCDEPHALPRSYRVGDWAWRFIMSNSRIPTTDEMLQHLRGGHVRAKVS